MLTSLGRRIERLFYIGFLIIIACFIEFYLSVSGAYFFEMNEKVSEFYLNKIESKKEELDKAFTRQKNPSLAASDAEHDKRATRTRVELGLPPISETKRENSEKTYFQMISDIFQSFPNNHELQKTKILEIFSSEKSPEDIISELKKFQKEEENRSGIILGIETPRLFALQYGGTGYKVPASFLSLALFSALAPIALVWLGSFYITRQRELLTIRESSDYRQSFPHLLNIFPVIFVKLAQQMGVHQSRRTIYINRKIGGAVTGFFRCSLILLFLTPMFFCLCISLYNVYEVFSNFSVLYFSIGAFIVLTYLILGFLMVSQEITILYKKDFYA